MNPKSFLTLLTVTLIAVVIAWIAMGSSSGPGIRGEGTLMFPDLTEAANSVRQLRATRAGEVSTIVSSEKDGAVAWSIKERYGYPVPIEVVRGIVTGIVRLATIEAKTTKAAKYPRIRVEDPTGKKSKSAQVELFDGAGKKLAAVIIGLDKGGLGGPGEVYVRRPGEARAWLARGKVPIPEKRTGWINQMIVEVDLPRVRESTLFVTGEEPLRVYKKKESDQDFIVERMPKGFELKGLFIAEDIARAIQNLALQEVRPAKEVGIDVATPPRVRHITFDGLIVEVWLKEAGKKKWIAVRASANPKPAAGDKVDTAAIAKEVKKINATAGGWAYTLNDFETKNLYKTLAGMIQKIPGADTEPAAGGTPAPVGK